MIDMSSISAVLTSIKAATDIAKLIKDSVVSLEKAELKLKLAELISALADTKIQVAEIQQTLIDKDAEFRAAKEQLEVKEKRIWEKPYYWLNDGDKKDGPYCQRCYDDEHKLIRLQGNGQGVWYCYVCKNYYYDSSYQPPKPKAVGTGRRTWMDKIDRW